MKSSTACLTASTAAKRLGVSAKALRLYEQRGLLTPGRTAVGWRVYDPAAMGRAAEIVALRALGLSLAQVARVLTGDARDLAPALAAHQTRLESQAHDLAGRLAKLRDLRADLALGRAPPVGALAAVLAAQRNISVAFDLPWPWGGERFELSDIRALNYIVGPLGSGKTRFARRLAETLPNADFLGLERR
ncbi:MerR family transcriptional regulator [Elstera litoralis]|uniref:MerR family transcriptional regulator n=1 Tax=Elstera litoralis TaxID=552518 RepID=UPI000AEFB2C2|nr:MerR family transcriptional regulator [Elstera litoralis]